MPPLETVGREERTIFARNSHLKRKAMLFRWGIWYNKGLILSELILRGE
jgi:hypothetical protein